MRNEENFNSNEEPNKENKQDLESLRTVIKVNEEESPAQDSTDKNDSDVLKTSGPVPLSDTKSEETQNLLKNMKDFDNQIMKNQEDIGKLYKKIDGLSNDLDDLVSLYEIVSEQMNPFVGLSKVTKKRIEALENFTNEVDDLKNRMNFIESFAESAGFNLEDLRNKNGERSQELEESNITEADWENIISKMELSGNDVDVIIEKTLLDMELDKQIDFLINEYIENLII